MNSFATLIDEHHAPPLRHVLGRLLAHAKTADIAIGHLRLAGLDLTASETGARARVRVLLGQFDAAFLYDGSGGEAPEKLRRLALFAESGRLQIRRAPHHAWNPDFSIFTGLPGNSAATLLGAHYFGRPYPRFGTALTCFMTSASAVRLSRTRFEELWTAGYDVLPVVADTIRQVATGGA